MPKERFHLFLADECLKVLGVSWPQGVVNDRVRDAFLLGSIMPDTLYYDLPNFSFSPIAKSLHRFEGEAGLEFFGSWLGDHNGDLSPEARFWMLGMLSHYLADGFWHPLITRYARPHSWLCRGLRFSSRSCHHWLESQMEAYWLPHLGPPGGYSDILKSFQKKRTSLQRYFTYYREFLIRAGAPRIPKVSRIQRCFYWQTSLLQVFAHRRSGQWKERILNEHRFGQSFGVLIVPQSPAFHFLSACRLQQRHGVDNPCDGEFLAQSVSSISGHLLSLPAQS